ncbi:hypothetical protein SAMN05216556_10727 [Aequorivita viscosa]|uniref:Peptidase family M48 n=2 Tax=Aequorivita viscosa TaxID=797419 RepID=A0A1M6IFK8_9FLAO|nr:hypothetical protein SAMN05216556_10727 [Aequorivita viscosa]SHJ33229.1 hypothetical protein SAMN04487908_11426 [Aequorivita viscosa]
MSNFTKLLTCFTILILYFNISMVSAQNINLDNKIIPEDIKKEALVALSFFPELWDTSIEFKFKDDIKKSTMQAQPHFGSLFRHKEFRKYIIFISRKIKIEDENFTIKDIPSDVLIGWIGHELGHVMDYQHRSNVGLMILGAKYLFSSSSIKKIERTADTFAIAHGMGDYILKTKNFILDNANLSEKYKSRIRRLYISPEEVMELINENKVEEEIDVVDSNS